MSYFCHCSSGTFHITSFCFLWGLDKRRVLDGRKKNLLSLVFSSVVIHALYHDRHPDIGSFMHVSVNFVHRSLVWMQSMANLLTPESAFACSRTPTAFYCLIVLSQQGILFGRSQSRQLKYGFLVFKTLLYPYPNHGRAVCPDSNSSFLNV